MLDKIKEYLGIALDKVKEWWAIPYVQYGVYAVAALIVLLILIGIIKACVRKAKFSKYASLSTSFNRLNNLTSKKSKVSKQHIRKYLNKKYRKDVLFKTHSNYVDENKQKGLLVPDTLYTFDRDNRTICFAYVYENNLGNVLMILRGKKNQMKQFNKKHKSICRSSFPLKGNDNDWFAVVLTKAYKSAVVKKMLDASIRYISKSRIKDAD